MAISSKRLGMDQRITAASASRFMPALSSFIVCPMPSPVSAGPSISAVTIYQMAYEQARIAARWGRWNASIVPGLN